ncbi:MAG: hypothetical protein IKJ05_05035 [Oscillospiraceae bacterium]|nr:hypothetical protein [Oscillospiraceae bacterium]
MEKGLLYYLNGNVQMGMESTRHMIEICDDERLRRSLLDDLHAYEKFENAIVQTKGLKPIKPLSPMAEAGTEMAMDMKVMFDDSKENMAKMLVKGYEMGIKDIRQNINKFSDSPQEELELAQGYLNFMKLTHAKYKGY